MLSELPMSPMAPLCPHCLAPVAVQQRPVAVRCDCCRLVVGAGRTVTAEEAAASGRITSTAANILSARARRETPDTPADPEIAARDVRQVAEAAGVSPDQLRMLEYQAAWRRNPHLASLAHVLAAFGTWKAARAAITAEDRAIARRRTQPGAGLQRAG